MSDVTVVVTVNGGRKTAHAVRAGGALLGYETSNTRPPTFGVEFCDYPFTDPSSTLAAHYAAVKRERPLIAVAPDLDTETDEATVYAQADLLAEYADAVVVVPKAVHPRAVPDRFRVGVPLANFGGAASTPWPWDAYRETDDLHLLGGSPTTQLEFGRYIDGVSSLDGAAVLKGAAMGSVWAPTPERNWHPTGGEQMGFYDRVTASIENVVEAWRTRRCPSAGEYTVPYDPEVYAQVVAPALEPIETEHAYRRHGAHGARPWIDAADADCLPPEERDAFEVIDWTARREAAEARALAAYRGPDQQAQLTAFGGDGDE